MEYWALQTFTTRNKSTILSTDDFFGFIRNAKVFLKLNLKTEFNQIRMISEGIEKKPFNIK